MFYGRYGMDKFNKYLLIIGGILAALTVAMTLITGRLGALWLMTLVIFGWVVFRALSRNKYKRQRENAAFEALLQRIRTARPPKARRAPHIPPTWEERKKYKYLNCPNCRQRLRIPRGKGKLKVTCSRCGIKFGAKS